MKHRSLGTNARLCGCGNCHDAATRAQALVAELVKEEACGNFAALVFYCANNMVLNWLIRQAKDDPELHVPQSLVPRLVTDAIDQQHTEVMAYIQEYGETFMKPVFEMLDAAFDKAMADVEERRDNP